MKPITRIENFLARIAGDEGTVLTPITRVEKFLQRIIDTGGGGGSGTDENAVHYTADSFRTPQQKRLARTNIDAETKRFVVNVTESGGVISADKTLEEIDTAYGLGADVVVDFYDYKYRIFWTDAADFVFACIVYDNSNSLVSIRILTLWGGAGWQHYVFQYQPNPTQVTDLSSASITLSLAADNTIYSYGELTALTVTAIDNPGDFVIRFTSGTTPTTTNFPASMIFPEAFAAEANTRYEINVSDGYALAVGWPTT